MSAFARTALRLAGIAALKADPVIAALVGGRVFDSRIESLAETEPVPVIIVLTEEMTGDAWSGNNGGAPFDDRCELVLEIGARAVVQPDDGAAVIGTPETNAELEALLDLVEHRAVDALTAGDTAQSLLVRRAVTRRVSKQHSVRYADAETGIKLALRTVTLTAHLKGEDQGDATFVADPLVAVATQPGGNTGDGTLTAATPAADRLVDLGVYHVALTGTAAFTVTDPRGAALPAGTVGIFYPGPGVRFTLVAGPTPFVAGDAFTLTVTQGEFAALPDPLRTVCDAMADGSSGQAICRLIAAAMPAPSIDFFTGADATYAPQPELDPVTAPIPPDQGGSHDTFGDDIEIP